MSKYDYKVVVQRYQNIMERDRLIGNAVSDDVSFEQSGFMEFPMFSTALEQEKIPTLSPVLEQGKILTFPPVLEQESIPSFQKNQCVIKALELAHEYCVKSNDFHQITVNVTNDSGDSLEPEIFGILGKHPMRSDDNRHWLSGMSASQVQNKLNQIKAGSTEAWNALYIPKDQRTLMANEKNTVNTLTGVGGGGLGWAVLMGLMMGAGIPSLEAGIAFAIVGAVALIILVIGAVLGCKFASEHAGIQKKHMPLLLSDFNKGITHTIVADEEPPVQGVAVADYEAGKSEVPVAALAV